MSKDATDISVLTSPIFLLFLHPLYTMNQDTTTEDPRIVRLQEEIADLKLALG
jgi:hypothetical protein